MSEAISPTPGKEVNEGMSIDELTQAVTWYKEQIHKANKILFRKRKEAVKLMEQEHAQRKSKHAFVWKTTQEHQ